MVLESIPALQYWIELMTLTFGFLKFLGNRTGINSSTTIFNRADDSYFWVLKISWEWYWNEFQHYNTESSWWLLLLSFKISWEWHWNQFQHYNIESNRWTYLSFKTLENGTWINSSPTILNRDDGSSFWVLKISWEEHRNQFQSYKPMALIYLLKNSVGMRSYCSDGF